MRTNKGRRSDYRSILAVCIFSCLYLAVHVCVCAPVRLSAPAERGPRSCIALEGEEGALLLPAPISGAAGDWMLPRLVHRSVQRERTIQHTFTWENATKKLRHESKSESHF